MLMENNQASIYGAACTVQKIINAMKVINKRSKIMSRLQTLAALLNDIAQTRRGSDPRSFIDDSIILSEEIEMAYKLVLVILAYGQEMLDFEMVDDGSIAIDRMTEVKSIIEEFAAVRTKLQQSFMSWN